MEATLFAQASADPEHLSFVHLASQMDIDHNGMEAEFEANLRNPKPEMLGSNGLPLTPAGSMQISDAIYRHLAARLG